MKITIYIAFILFAVSCGTAHSEKSDEYQDIQVNESEATNVNTDVSPNDSIVEFVAEEFSELQTYYIACLDSSKNYFTLDKSLYKNAKKYHVIIDTAGRSYNIKKDLIALPEDAEDEMYAGEYYPRRYPSTNLSLEYLYVYDENINDKTIGLIAGICEEKSEADSILNIFKPTNPNGFVLKGKVYVGCMH